MITDHNLLLCTVHHPKPWTRKLQSINLPSFREGILQGLRVNNGSESVSDLLNRYNGHLTSVLDIHAPKKEMSVVVRPLQPWFTDKLHQARNGRRKAERLW